MEARRPLTDEEYRTIFTMIDTGGPVGEVIKALPIRDGQTVRRAYKAIALLSERGKASLSEDEAERLAEIVLYGATGNYIMTLHKKLTAWREGKLGHDTRATAVKFEVEPQIHRNMAKLNVRNLSGETARFEATGMLEGANVILTNEGLHYPLKWLGTRSESVEIIAGGLRVIDVVAIGIPRAIRFPFSYLPRDSLCLNFLVGGEIEGAPYGYFPEGRQSDSLFRLGRRKNIEIILNVSIQAALIEESSSASTWLRRFRVSPGANRNDVGFEALPDLE